MARDSIDERFDGDRLDADLWVPYYLPHWSSRQASAATYAVGDGELRLTIPPGQCLWCADTHEEPLRVSCIQSASYAGPVGSRNGPQPFREGLVVKEAQPTLWGYTPTYGRIEVRMKAEVDPASMFAFWMSGIEDRPERSGEICAAEVFGSSIRDGMADIGMGIHRFRDPRLAEAFTTIPVRIDTAVFHDYGVDWSPDAVELRIDGQPVHRVAQSPDYPMQLMIGVFDFPARRSAHALSFTPRLSVSRVTGFPMGAQARTTADPG